MNIEESFIAEAIARWYGNQAERRPLARVLVEEIKDAAPKIENKLAEDDWSSAIDYQPWLIRYRISVNSECDHGSRV